MMKRPLLIATGSFCHETNSFSSVLVTEEIFAQHFFEKEEFFNQYGGVKTYCGGYIDEADALGVTLIPTLHFSMTPCGRSVRKVVETARDRMVELLYETYKAQPYDGIALFMHGAGAGEDYHDIEGEILGAIRNKMGWDIPIGVALDLHGNISQKMVDCSDILIGCKEYPHVDEYDTGRRLFRMLCDMIENGSRPCKRLIKLPWHLVPAQGVTTSGPACEVKQLCLAREAQDDNLFQASFFQGFPYADVPDASVSVVTMAKTQECADRNALDIARYAWDKREEFAVPLYSAQEAVRLALQAKTFPVLINESADNPGGGAPGDGTYLLRALLEQNVPSAFGFLYDPEVAHQAACAGEGATICCLLGGKTDRCSGEAIALKDAYVSKVCQGRFLRKSPMGKGSPTDLGTTVCLTVGNVSVIVASSREQTFDDGPFEVAGVDWTKQTILALKSAQHFRGWWGDRVGTIISCDPPGVQSADLRTFDLQNADTSFYPLQPNLIADPKW